MRISRKAGLLAALSATLLFAFASTAMAVAPYSFLDDSNTSVFGGKFGENIALQQAPDTTIDLTVPTDNVGGTATNHCSKAFIGGQVFANDPSATLIAYVRAAAFSSCDLAKIYAAFPSAARWTLSVKQGIATTAHKSGRVSGVDVLARSLEGIPGFDCEYSGAITVDLVNGTPSEVHLGKVANTVMGNKLNLVPMGAGSATTSPNCPPFGLVSGTLVFTNSSATNNLHIG